MTEDMKKWIEERSLEKIRRVLWINISSDPLLLAHQDTLALCGDWLYEPHIDLVPFTEEQAKWTKDYWSRIYCDLEKNFSRERFDYLKRIAEIAVPDVIAKKKAFLEKKKRERIEAEQKADELKRIEERIEAERKVKEQAEALRAEQARKAQAASSTPSPLQTNHPQSVNPPQPARIYRETESARQRRKAKEQQRLIGLIVAAVLIIVVLVLLLKK